MWTFTTVSPHHVDLKRRRMKVRLATLGADTLEFTRVFRLVDLKTTFRYKPLTAVRTDVGQ